MFDKGVLASLLHINPGIHAKKSEVKQQAESKNRSFTKIPSEVNEAQVTLTEQKRSETIKSVKAVGKSSKKTADSKPANDTKSSEPTQPDNEDSTPVKRRLHKSRKRKSTDMKLREQNDDEDSEPSVKRTKVTEINNGQDVIQVSDKQDGSSKKKRKKKNNKKSANQNDDEDSEPSVKRTKVTESNNGQDVIQVSDKQDGSSNKKRKKKNNKKSANQDTGEDNCEEKTLDPLKMKLMSSRFRFINEQLYTTTSQEAMTMFNDDPSSFTVYHAGYRNQIEKWPVKPIDQAVQYVSKRPKSDTIVDMGCGEAILSTRVPHQVYSYDLIALNKRVIQSDMANIPLKDGTADVVVFCLSLMGTNLSDFITEAHRLLKDGGTLWIAEVASRFHGELKQFCQDVESIGFSCSFRDGKTSTHFITITFKKIATAQPISTKSKKTGGAKSSKTGRDNSKTLPEITLAPCLYKKR